MLFEALMATACNEIFSGDQVISHVKVAVLSHFSKAALIIGNRSE
jgi:hypothetical protein